MSIRVEVANQLRQMADDAAAGTDQHWTLTRAAELLEQRRVEAPLAVSVFRAYARNSGNNPDDHYDMPAAIQWMQQALEECGVIVWNDECRGRAVRVYMADAAGCGARLEPGQYWSYCGETDMGQAMPVRCTHCGGALTRKGDA